MQPRPLPLNTVALLKAASEVLGLGPGDAMYYAEKLYLNGLLSYPRTETSKFAPAFDLVGTLSAVAFSRDGARTELAVDTLLLHIGVVPNTQITRQVFCEHEWYAPQRYWRPVRDDWGATSQAQIAVAGDGGGIDGAAAAALHGRLAALDAACRQGKIELAERNRRADPIRYELAGHQAIRPLLDTLFRPPQDLCAPPDDATLVCRCEEISAGDIREAVALGAMGPNQLKAFTRCGMGPCQGRMCGLTVAELVAQAKGESVEDVGYYRIRPPIKPVTMGELAAMADD